MTRMLHREASLLRGFSDNQGWGKEGLYQKLSVLADWYEEHGHQFHVGIRECIRSWERGHLRLCVRCRVGTSLEWDHFTCPLCWSVFDAEEGQDWAVRTHRVLEGIRKRLAEIEGA